MDLGFLLIQFLLNRCRYLLPTTDWPESVGFFRLDYGFRYSDWSWL